MLNNKKSEELLNYVLNWSPKEYNEDFLEAILYLTRFSDNLSIWLSVATQYFTDAGIRERRSAIWVVNNYATNLLTAYCN